MLKTYHLIFNLCSNPVRAVLAFIFICFGLHSFEAKSQACFQFLGDSVGCAPFKIRVRSCADAGAIVSFFFDWHSGSTDYITLPPGITDTSFTYTNPGTYIIYQLRGGTDFVQKTVKVFSQNARPSFTWNTCRDTLRIQFADTVFSGFQFLPGDGQGPRQISGGNTLFRYRYNFSGGKATFPFEVQGRIPGTCSQDGVKDTATLYKISQAPLADSLIGISTQSFRTTLGVRADEAYIIQTNQNGNWQTLVENTPPRDSPQTKDQISVAETNSPFQMRTGTRTGCGDTLLAPSWTVIWPNTIPENQKITITWARVNIPDVVTIELWRNGQKIKGLQPGIDSVFVDTAGLVCGKDYCYQLFIVRQVAGYSGKLVFLSPPNCTQASSNATPPPLENITASIKSTGIEVGGKIPAQAIKFSLWRKEKEGEGFQSFQTSAVLPILDTDADFNNRAYCYRIQYQDKCNNISALSDSVCPVWLRVTELDDARYQFQWTRMEGWKGGLERYDLVRTTPEDAPLFWEMGKSQSYTMIGREKTRQRVFYTIYSFANDKDTYPTSLSNTVEIVQKAKFRFPEIFTPNDDRINDNFTCAALFVTDFEMKIFNPWGEMVFFSEKITEGWNGKIDSKPAPNGVYAYWAKGTDMEGNTMESRGYFTLMR